MKLYLTPEGHSFISSRVHLDKQPTTARESILGGLWLAERLSDSWSRRDLLDSWTLTTRFAKGPFRRDLARMTLDELIEEGLVEER